MIGFMIFWITINLALNMIYFIVMHKFVPLPIVLSLAILTGVWYSVFRLLVD